MLKPEILFADEPTGNLDSETGARVMQYLLEGQKKEGNGLILVSHNPKTLDTMDVVYELKNGTLVKNS